MSTFSEPIKIPNAYDSHVHWLGTGENLTRLNLRNLRSPLEVSLLKIEEHHYSGEWLLGSGWDDNVWRENSNKSPSSKTQFSSSILDESQSDEKSISAMENAFSLTKEAQDLGDLNSIEPTKEILDRVFPNTPVAFRRVDGHALWVNSEALRRLRSKGKSLDVEIKGGRIERLKNGEPSGVFVDQAVTLFSGLIPKNINYKKALLEGSKYFNSQGFTHIRDMSCSESQWNESVQLDHSGELTLYVDQTFHCENPDDFEKPMALAKRASKEKTRHLNPTAVKIYYDGALGSEGALLSQNYAGKNHAGFRLAEPTQIKKIIKEIWSNGLPVAVHVIGDQAAHEVTLAAYDLTKELKFGELHLEHVQMLRPETIKLLKEINVTCHLQPCHWLSDKRWLKQKLGPLFEHLFRWEELEKNEIKFQFGSDSPIEPSGLWLGHQAVMDAAESGIPKTKKSVWKYFEYPMTNQGRLSERESQCETLIQDGRIQSVVFDGTKLI